MVLDVVSDKNPNVNKIGIEVGNFSFEDGIACFVQFIDANNDILNRKIFRLKGDDFYAWMNEPDGAKMLVTKILEFTECKIKK
jgi:hypothetical protein